MTRRKFSILAIALLLAGCRQNTPTSGLRVVPMQIGSRTFNLEVANTFVSQEHGLMQRDSMPTDHGMIFVFDRSEVLSFYMKNTRFPLDIIFMDDAGRIVSIRQMKAYDLTPISSDAPAKYAIELNVGASSSAGVHVGDVLRIPADALKPP
jgi:uncharacterized protein